MSNHKSSAAERNLKKKGYEVVAIASQSMISKNDLLRQYRDRGYHARAVKQPGSPLLSIMTKRGRHPSNPPTRIVRDGISWNEQGPSITSREYAKKYMAEMVKGKGSLQQYRYAKIVPHTYTYKNTYNPDMAGPGYEKHIRDNPYITQTTYHIYTRGRPGRTWATIDKLQRNKQLKKVGNRWRVV